MAIINGLSAMLAEEANLLERSVLTEPEAAAAIMEVEPEAPQAPQVMRRINRGARQSKQGVIPTGNLTIRANYSVRAHMLPDHIRQHIASGSVKIVNQAFYKILHFTGRQGELMFNADTKKAGDTNINARKLEDNNFFLLTSIILQSATAANLATANFGLPAAQILNGEFSLKNGDKIIVPPTSARVFNTTGNDGATIGEWKLDNPKFLAPLTEIIPELKLPADVPANTAVKIVLVGAGVERA